MLYWEKITYSLKLKRGDYWIYIYSFGNYMSNLVFESFLQIIFHQFVKPNLF